MRHELWINKQKHSTKCCAQFIRRGGLLSVTDIYKSCVPKEPHAVISRDLSLLRTIKTVRFVMSSLLVSQIAAQTSLSLKLWHLVALWVSRSKEVTRGGNVTGAYQRRPFSVQLFFHHMHEVIDVFCAGTQSCGFSTYRERLCVWAGPGFGNDDTITVGRAVALSFS